MEPQVTEIPSIARGLTARVTQPNGRVSERHLIVNTGSCLYCNKRFYCVHAIRGRTIARHRGRYLARRQKRLRTPRRRVARSITRQSRSNRLPIVPRGSASDPVRMAPTFSPSARGIGFQRVCQFWNDMLLRLQAQFAQGHFDNIPTPVPEAQDAEAQDMEAQDAEAQDMEAQDAEALDAEAQDTVALDAEAQDADSSDENAENIDLEDTDLELRLGIHVENDGMDLTLKL